MNDKENSRGLIRLKDLPNNVGELRATEQWFTNLQKAESTKYNLARERAESALERMREIIKKMNKK
jgi:hypothetical protein